MGWPFGDTTGSERAADTVARSSEANRAHRERMSDVNWKRQQGMHQSITKQQLLADYRRRNQQHKKAAFDVEMQEARRENRAPRITSPEEVMDLPLPPELREPETKPADLRWLKWIGIALGFYIAHSIAQMILGPLPGIISIPVMIAFIITEIWVFLLILAKGDPDKIARADKFHPVKLARKTVTWIKDRFGSATGTAQAPGAGHPEYDERP